MLGGWGLRKILEVAKDKNILLKGGTTKCRRKEYRFLPYAKGRLNILRFFAYISNLIFWGFFERGLTINLWSFSPKPEPLAGELPVIFI